MLTAERVSFSYGDHKVLNDLSVEIRDGAVTTLLGANGCGKTTLLRLLTKSLRPQEGRVFLGGHDISSISVREYARMTAIVQQKNSAPDDLTVERLVSYGRLPYSSILRAQLSDENMGHVRRALELTGLTELRDRPVGTLSGGQRQRAFIAMALAQDTKVLLLDEPTTFLDVRYQVEILQLVRRLNREQGMTIVMVLHDINQALAYSDEVIGLLDGRIAFQGRPEDVISAESIKRIYGIELPVLNTESGLLVPAIAAEKDASACREVSVQQPSEGDHSGDAAPEKVTPVAEPKKKGGIMKAVCIIVGFIALGLGAVGVALPILPTTPFLLVAAFCFARSSERLNTWFKGTRLYKDNLESFAKGQGMTKKAKLRIMTTVTLLMAFAFYMMYGKTKAGCIAISVVWLCHMIAFCFFIKTCPEGEGAEGEVSVRDDK